MSSALQDVQYALRLLRRRPAFTAAAVLTLALGIGATTGIFTVADRALVRSLPVDAPDRLVHVVTDRGGGRINYNFSYPRYLDHRDRAGVFSGVLAQSALPLAWMGAEGTQRISGAAVTANFFDVLGVRPVLGRGFAPEEEAGAVPVAVLSHEVWIRSFGASPSVLGRALVLNGREFTVIGIAPEGFRGLSRGRVTDVWIPVTVVPQLTGSSGRLEDRQASWLNVFARLAPGIERMQAAAAIDVLSRQLQAEGLVPDTERTLLLDGARGLTSLVGDVSLPLRLLSAVVVLVLLIACANVANLLLARATARRRELAIRASLGAGRRRLLRQLMTESLVLGLLGGAAGLVVAQWISELLLTFRPPTGIALEVGSGLDGRMLAIAGAATLVTALVFGLAPAFWGARPDPARSLKADARGTSGGGLGLRGALVVGQIALSLVLVVGAGLLGRSLANLQAVDVGFEPQGVLLARLDLESAGYEPDRGRAFYRDLLAPLEATPGVEAATLARTVTPHPWGSNIAGVALEGYEPPPEDEVSFDVNFVGPRYFETLGIALREGRSFTPGDHSEAPQVAIVNEAMARRYWADDAVGRRIYFGADSTAPAVQVVGVATDGKYRSLREAPSPNVYLPILQTYFPDAAVLLRVRGSPERFTPLLREAVRELDPELPLFDVRTLGEHVALARSQERMAASLVGLFGALALVLAVVGIYGAMSFFVGQRTREIGVRIALGAEWRDVIGLVLGLGSRRVLLGIALGLAGALALGRVLAGLLYDVSPLDPATYAAAALAVAGAALAAAYLPARRAAKVDPMEALRQE